MQYTRILQKLGYPVSLTEFTIQNMVASCSVMFPIRLEGLAARFDIFCNYEPEVFPGLVFRMRKPKLVLLIFVTGKIVLTGAKRVEEINSAFETIYAVLQVRLLHKPEVGGRQVYITVVLTLHRSWVCSQLVVIAGFPEG